MRRNDEFNVLTVEQVHAVARAAEDSLLAAMILVAAFTGLRQGELLALRWRHVDFANRILHVRRNLPAGAIEEERRSRTASAASRSPTRRWSRSTGSAAREHFTGPDDLVFCDAVGGHLSGDAARDGFYARSTRRRARAPAREGRPDRLPRPAAHVRHAVRGEGDRPREDPEVDGSRRHPDDDAVPALRAAARRRRPPDRGVRDGRCAPRRAPNRRVRAGKQRERPGPDRRCRAKRVRAARTFNPMCAGSIPAGGIDPRDAKGPRRRAFLLDADRGCRRDPFSGRLLQSSSERPACRRDHWAVGRSLVRKMSRVASASRCGQPAGESSQVSCRP